MPELQQAGVLPVLVEAGEGGVGEVLLEQTEELRALAL
jgi:hypothetical protein